MKRALGVLAVGLLSCGLAAAPAEAADVVTDELATVTTAQQVAAFWLGDGGANLRNATPYDVQTAVSGDVLPGDGVPIDGKPGTTTPLPSDGSDTANAKAPAASGKVFFVGADGRPHWCTGTAMRSTYYNMVATAGHCVYDLQADVTHDKWVFIPGYTEGTAPSGLYVGKRVSAHYEFALYRDHDRNYAFVNVYNGVVPSPAGGLTDVQRLGDNVGGQGLAYNQQPGDPVEVFGYPAGPHPDGTRPYSGDQIESSTGQTVSVAVPGLPAEDLIAVDSRFTGEGALGSSWLSHYDDKRGIGYLTGITISVVDTDGDQRYDTSLSPYFDGDLNQVYRAAVTTWTGSIV